MSALPTATRRLARVAASLLLAVSVPLAVNIAQPGTANALPSKSGLVYEGTECQLVSLAAEYNATHPNRHWSRGSKFYTPEDLGTCEDDGTVAIHDVWGKPAGWQCGTFNAETTHRGFFNAVPLWKVEFRVKGCFNGKKVYYKGKPSVRAYALLPGSEVSLGSCSTEGAPLAKKDAVTGGFSIECSYTFKSTNTEVTVGGSVSGGVGIEVGGEGSVTIPLGTAKPIYHTMAIYPDGTGEVSGTDSRSHAFGTLSDDPSPEN